MLGKFLAHLVGGHTDDSVLAGIEVLRELEQLDADVAFFKGAVRTVDGVLNDVLQELPASLAGAKGIALQQAIEFRPHGLLA